MDGAGSPRQPDSATSVCVLRFPPFLRRAVAEQRYVTGPVPPAWPLRPEVSGPRGWLPTEEVDTALPLCPLQCVPE